MSSTPLKQSALKPQDFIVAVKVCVNTHRDFLLTTLSNELGMALSAVHASIARCEQSKLISRATGGIRPIKPAVLEFAVHGVRYAFPAIHGALTRGMATSLSGPSLRGYFDQGKAMPLVWPDPHGDAQGTSLTPLHHTVPDACRVDEALLDVLTLIDAVRAGAARERELATNLLRERLS